jgi:hypothetical protein
MQNSKESLKSLARKYSINPKTVAKWRKRDFTQDFPMGPKDPKSTALTSRKKQYVWHLENMHCYLLITACMLCKLLYQNLQDLLYIGYLSVITLMFYLLIIHPVRQRSSLKLIRLAISI